MKKIFLLIFLLPVFALGQNIINIKPLSLMLGNLSLSYEREITEKHSLTIGLPLYFKRDIANMTLVKSLVPTLVNSSRKDANDLLDDARGIGYLSGSGIIFKYKMYLSQNSKTLTGRPIKLL